MSRSRTFVSGGLALAMAMALATGPAVAAAAKSKRAKAAAKPRQVIARVSRATCRRLVTEHAPRPDVEYAPGRDVHGRPVAPADVPGEPDIALPQVFRIRLAIDLEDLFGLQPIPGQDTDVLLGTITLRGDKVYFNGQPLEDPHRGFLIDACRRRLHRARRR